MSTKEWREKNADKVRAARRRWYEKNKKRAKASVMRRKREMSLWFKELKSRLSCEKCGEDHAACICFHHKDPSKKEINLGKVVVHGWSKERIMEEISKCQVLCQNCHAKIHWGNEE
jgi:hypothetical protein